MASWQSVSLPTQVASGHCEFEDFFRFVEAKEKDEVVAFESMIELGGTKWGLRVYPAGDASSTTGNVSVFLKNCGKRTVKVSGSISLLNAAGESGYTQNIEAREFTAGQGCGYSNFITTSALRGPKKHLLVQGALRFKFTVIVACQEIKKSLPVAGVAAPTEGKRLRLDLGALFKSGKCSDASLRAPDMEDLKVHRAVLTARSPVFDRMFDTQMAEAASGVVRIEDTKPNVLRALCEFIYTDGIEDEAVWADAAFVREMMFTAAKYEVADLLQVCVGHAAAKLAVANVVEWLQTATRLDVAEFKAQCLRFIAANMAAVQVTEGWKQLVADKKAFAELAPELFLQMRPPA